MEINRIREKLVSYLARGITLESFEDWIAQNTWDIRRTGPDHPEVYHLVFSIELRLSEFSSGHLSIEDLRKHFENLLAFYETKIPIGAVQTGGSNMWVLGKYAECENDL